MPEQPFFDKKTGFMGEGRIVEIIYLQFSQAFNTVSQCSDTQVKVVLSQQVDKQMDTKNIWLVRHRE